MRAKLGNLTGADVKATQTDVGAVAETLLAAYPNRVYPEQFGATVGTGGMTLQPFRQLWIAELMGRLC